jgi:hypothetical protein
MEELGSRSAANSRLFVDVDEGSYQSVRPIDCREIEVGIDNCRASSKTVSRNLQVH